MLETCGRGSSGDRVLDLGIRNTCTCTSINMRLRCMPLWFPSCSSDRLCEQALVAHACSPSPIPCSSLPCLRPLAMPAHPRQSPVYSCHAFAPLPCLLTLANLLFILAMPSPPCHARPCSPIPCSSLPCRACPLSTCSEAHTSRMSAGDADESPQYAQHHLSHSISFPASVSARLVSYIRLSFRACQAVFA